MTRHLAWPATLLALAAHAATGDPDLSVATRPVALSHQPAPDVDPPVNFILFGRPIIRDDGGVAFEAMLDRTVVGPDDDRGIWLYADTVGELVLRESADPPRRLEPPQFAPSGDLIVTRREDGVAVHAYRDGVMTRVVGEGDIIASNGAALQFIWPPVMLGPDFVTFWGGAGSGGSLLTTRSGVLRYLPDSQDVFPGAPCRPEVHKDVAISARGEHVLASASSCPPSVWRQVGDSWAEVARRYHPLPHDPNGYYVCFDFVSAGSDRIAFFGKTSAPPPPYKRYEQYVSDADGAALFTGAGRPAPGIPGATIALPTVPLVPRVLDNDQLVLMAALTGDDVNELNNQAVWRGEPDGMTLLVREGDHIPGLPDDVVIRDIQTLAVNEHYAAAYVTLFGFTVGDNDRALVLIDPDGDLHLVARVGDKFRVAEDGTDLRPVRSIVMSAGRREFGHDPINDTGDLVFGLEFHDGTSGVFVAELAPPCVGDLNGDGMTNLTDLGILLAAFEINDEGDTDGDGDTDISDLGALLGDIGCGT